jgi:hypothetical protein
MRNNVEKKKKKKNKGRKFQKTTSRYALVEEKKEKSQSACGPAAGRSETPQPRKKNQNPQNP